jgi:hypothetical protein
VLPPLTEDAQSNLFVAGHIVRCLLRRGRIGDLLNRADDIAPQERGKRLHALWTDLVEYYDSLPQPLHFSVSTFQRAMTADQGPAFIYLHVLLQSTMSLINRPQLLRRFESSFVAAPTKLASIAAHASSTIVSILRFAEDARHDRADRLEDGSRRDFNQFLDTSPYLDREWQAAAAAAAAGQHLLIPLLSRAHPSVRPRFPRRAPGRARRTAPPWLHARQRLAPAVARGRRRRVGPAALESTVRRGEPRQLPARP